jgi:hypothetical protein
MLLSKHLERKCNYTADMVKCSKCFSYIPLDELEEVKCFSVYVQRWVLTCLVVSFVWVQLPCSEAVEIEELDRLEEICGHYSDYIRDLFAPPESMAGYDQGTVHNLEREQFQKRLKAMLCKRPGESVSAAARCSSTATGEHCICRV